MVFDLNLKMVVINNRRRRFLIVSEENADTFAMMNTADSLENGD